MLGLGPAEMMIILALVLIVFGAGKLPDVFGSLGKGIREFRNAADEPQTVQATESTKTTVASVPVQVTTIPAQRNGVEQETVVRS